jgi:circadian clock protein KaiB
MIQKRLGKARPSAAGRKRKTSAGPSARKAPSARRPARPRAGKAPGFKLKLYVTGLTPGSQKAIERVRAACETHLQGRYALEVIDIYQRPALAKDEQIIATPTLIRVLPPPLRRYIGSLANAEKVLFGIDLRPAAP